METRQEKIVQPGYNRLIANRLPAKIHLYLITLWFFSSHHLEVIETMLFSRHDLNIEHCQERKNRGFSVGKNMVNYGLELLLS